MRLRWLVPALLLVIAPTLRADDKDEKVDAAMEKLQGKWLVVTYKNDGKDESPKSGTVMAMEIKKNHYTLKKDGDEEYRGDLKIDSPGKITATLFDAKDKKLGEALGIYKMDGEKLTICWDEESGDRPTEFSSESGSKDRLIELIKAK